MQFVQIKLKVTLGLLELIVLCLILFHPFAIVLCLYLESLGNKLSLSQIFFEVSHLFFKAPF